jgi:peptide/nickel transport system substrate-binding protein
VRLGAALSFNLAYASGIDYMESSVKELVSNADLVGIHIIATPGSAGNVIGSVFCNTAPGQPACPQWQLAEWGSWTYAPDYLPTGEELFGGASVNNGGHYNVAKNNTLIAATLSAGTETKFMNAMYAWENWLAPQLPVVYTPDVATLVESVSNLVIGQQSPTLLITPEDWYYLK